MDPITHAALGAVCAQGVLYNKTRNAWIVGALAAMAPDLDVFIQSAKDPLSQFLYHRHFTHALIFIPLGALVVTLFLMPIQSLRKNWQYTFLAALIGYATQAPLDAMTNYGTLLYWPFSDKRVHWNLVSIVDPFVTLPLILGLIWTLIHKTGMGLIAGLSFAASVIILNVFQQERSISLLQDYARKEQWNMRQFETYPALGSSIYWKGLVRTDKEFWLLSIKTPLFHSGSVIAAKNYFLSTRDNLPTYIKNSTSLSRDYFIFHWFCDGYLVALSQNPLLLSDGRFLKPENPPRSLWSLLFLPGKTHAEIIE